MRKTIQRDPDGRSDFVHFDLDGAGVALGDATHVVITTSSGIGRPITTNEAIALVTQLVRALRFDERRISASEDWQVTEARIRQREELYELAGRLQSSLAEVRAAAQGLGMAPSGIRRLGARPTPPNATRRPWGEGFQFMAEKPLTSWDYIYLSVGADPDEVRRREQLGLENRRRVLRGERCPARPAPRPSAPTTSTSGRAATDPPAECASWPWHSAGLWTGDGPSTRLRVTCCRGG